MKINNIKIIFMHQIKVNKLRLLFLLPGFMIIILMFILPTIVDYQSIQVNNYSELLSLYRQQNPLLDNNNLIIIMLTDIKLLNYLLVMSFIIPMFLTIDFIVKEKEERTIENLFSLPITDFEILLGKILVSLITTIIIIWFFYFSTLIVSYYYNYRFLLSHLFSLKWLFSIFILIPVISYFINIVAITISCLVNKYQTSQFVATLVLSPFMVFFVLISNGTLIFYNRYLIFLFVFTLITSIVFSKISIKLFNRERMLVRF
ncbi:ABC transporter permease subunit [Rosettibacter firmus]|uniref:ABC transporter permease subunit n=1 Tax=Rosettibacter firmus TaxID=3111522 RepID=UPI00336C1553